MKTLATVLICLVGGLNLLPVVGALGAGRLQSLYGVAFSDPNALILMQHRALLFGIVGGLLVASAFHAPLRPAGFAAGLFSMLSFVAVAWLVGGANAELRRVVLVDIVASVALAGAFLLDRRAG